MSSRTLGRAFGVVFTTICMLIIGPVFILPRVSSATHEMAVALFFPNFPLVATLAVFFILNYWVACNRAQVIDRLGKVLSPALIIFMAILIIKGIVSPIGPVPSTGCENPLADGVINGYNTMNALGAALFGGWVLKELYMRGITDKDAQTLNLFYIGPAVALALLVTSTGITYLGATAATSSRGRYRRLHGPDRRGCSGPWARRSSRCFWPLRASPPPWGSPPPPATSSRRCPVVNCSTKPSSPPPALWASV